jgi:hypothetical protein
MFRKQLPAKAMRSITRHVVQYVPRLRTLLVAFLLSLAIVRPAAATDYTDLWVTLGENAWGVNFVQSNASPPRANFMFATFFIYGPDQQPTWYTGEMSQDANGVWSGPLVRSTGSYFGGPWNEGQTTRQQVGTVTFTPSSSYAGTITYNVNTVVVTKQITRNTFTTIPLGATYFGGGVSIVSNCNDPANNGTFRYYTVITATQIAGGPLTLDFNFDGGGACRLTGTYVQNGQLYRIPNAAYSCNDTFFAGATVVSQVKATAQGIEGQWNALVGGGCEEAAFFSAVLN